MELRPGDVAVITGAASGIGYALAFALLERGLRVVLADIEEPALAAAAAALRGTGAGLLALPVDVSDPDAVDELAQRTLATFGEVHLVCNNAGVTGAGGPMWTLDQRDWEWALGVNLWGVVNGIRSFLPHLVERDRGHVVNTASLAGLASTPYTGPYNATKHAVVTITETLAAELAMQQSAVTTSVACPGFVATKIWEAERNRPASLAHDPAPAPAHPSYAAFAAAVSEMASDAQDPAETAARIIGGIERDDLHILTHPHMAPLVRERVHQLERALSAADAANRQAALAPQEDR